MSILCWGHQELTKCKLSILLKKFYGSVRVTYGVWLIQFEISPTLRFVVIVEYCVY